MAGHVNTDALFEAHYGHLRGEERRRARAEFDPYSRKAIQQSLQQMIMGALHELGGQRWLVKQADKYPVAFMALVAKNLPFEARGGGGDTLKIIVETSGGQEVIREDAPGVINTPLKLVSRRVIEGQVTEADAREIDPLCERKGLDKSAGK
jgi:hypothetical protein